MRIGIIGLGMIGGSLGGAWRRAGHEVTGYDASAAAMATASELGLVDRTYSGLKDLAEDRDIIVFSTPVSVIVDLLPTVAELATTETILTDVGSVKVPVIGAMNALLTPSRAVGGHPVAGRETSGPAYADPSMFAGRPYAIVPGPRSHPSACAAVERLVRDVGATPVRVAAEAHDEILARTSHLPQLLATLLMLTLRDTRHSPLTGSGLADMTRLAASDPDLWTDILCLNAGNVISAGQDFMAGFSHVLDCLAAGDGVAVRALMAAARDGSLLEPSVLGEVASRR